MAVIKTIQVHDSYGINSVSDYISNPEKTTMEPGEGSDPIQSEIDYGTNPAKTNIESELEYGMNAEKTTLSGADREHVLVDGYKCSPHTASRDFSAPRRLYELSHSDKNYREKKPVVAVHLIQSFAADPTLDPRLVHQIGMELVESLKEKGVGDFQAVVSTHMNTAHLHNHILLNAFSMDGSKKFCDNWTTRYMIREISDDLCRKYGLPIIEEKDKEKIRENIGEQYSRAAGVSWKEQMRQDIKVCIHSSSSYEEWHEQMSDLGYAFRRRADGTPISISDSAGNKARLSKLGPEYTYAGIIKAIAEEHGIDVETLQQINSMKQEQRQEREQAYAYIEYFKRVRRYDDYGRRRSDLQMMLLTLIAYLRKLIERLRRRAEQQKSKELEAQIALTDKQLKDLTKTLAIMEKYGINRLSDLGAMKKQVGHDNYVAKKGAEELLQNIAALEKAENEAEYPEFLYQVSPMASAQRQKLYLLSRETGWHIHGKFDTLSAGEASEAINFMMSDAAKNPNLPQEEIPAILRYDFRPTPATRESVADELDVMRVMQRNFADDRDRLSSEYKDLVFIDKNCQFTKKQYQNLSEQSKKYHGKERSEKQQRDTSVNR